MEKNNELGDRMELSSFPDIKKILQSPVRHEYWENDCNYLDVL